MNAEAKRSKVGALRLCEHFIHTSNESMSTPTFPCSATLSVHITATQQPIFLQRPPRAHTGPETLLRNQPPLSLLFFDTGSCCSSSHAWPLSNALIEAVHDVLFSGHAQACPDSKGSRIATDAAGDDDCGVCLSMRLNIRRRFQGTSSILASSGLYNVDEC